MNRTKEYNDRNSKPLVNPGITLGEYESTKTESECSHDAIRLTGKFETENLDCPCGFSIPF